MVQIKKQNLNHSLSSWEKFFFKSVTTDIADLIGKKTKKPTQPAKRKLLEY